MVIPFPQNCAQTSAIGPAKISNRSSICSSEILRRRDTFHSGEFKVSRNEVVVSFARFERAQHCQSARINRIDHLFDLQQVARENLPAMPQGRRRLQRPIISGIVRTLAISTSSISMLAGASSPPGVVAMTEDKASSDAAISSCPIRETFSAASA